MRCPGQGCHWRHTAWWQCAFAPPLSAVGPCLWWENQGAAGPLETDVRHMAEKLLNWLPEQLEGLNVFILSLFFFFFRFLFFLLYLPLANTIANSVVNGPSVQISISTHLFEDRRYLGKGWYSKQACIGMS